MKRDSGIRVWPLLCILGILFIWQVRAPRPWRRVMISPLGELVGVVAAQTEVRVMALGEPPVPLGFEVSIPVKHQHLVPQELAVRRVTDGPAEAEREAQVAPPRRAPIGPLVARQFGDSPVLRDTAPPREREFANDVSIEQPVGLRLASREGSPASPSPAAAVMQRRPQTPRDGITRWPHASALTARLEALSAIAPQHSDWCARVRRELATLSTFDSLTADAVGQTLQRLQQLRSEGQAIAERTEDATVRNELARSVHGLRRRLAVWQGIHDVAAATDSPVSISVRDSLQLRRVIGELESSLQNVKHRAAWLEYLQVAEARMLDDTYRPTDTSSIRQFARGILSRMEYARLTPEQREFLQQPAFLAYSQELKHLAAEPVDYFRLMQELEDYETRGSSEPANWLATAQQTLRWSHQEPVMRLGQEMDAHYRNANLRLAVSTELLGRLLPPSHLLEQPIDERILGIRTRGHSESMTRLRVAVLPSESSWQLRLLAEGDVASLTSASHGPATFVTRGWSRFTAEKQIVVHPGGIRHQRTDVAAHSDTDLAGLRTDMDGVPLLGDIVQSIAARQYRSRATAAEWEAKHRLAHRVGSMIDEQVEQQIDEIQQRFVDHFHRPLRQLHLNPIALEMRTTEQRVIARYRLAGNHQLAAHTPRPLAPGNSLLSLQLHESALNNVIEQFGWSGRRVNLRDVYRDLAELFALPEIQPPDDLPHDVMIRFADRNPLRLTFEDGRVRVTLGLAELSQGRNRWRNFVVRVHYQPAPDQPEADLVRDQYVELMGRLAFGDQITLRGIFSRVFSREKPINLITQRLAGNPRLHGLALQQMEIGDGWLALAIGPAESPALAAPRPAAPQPVRVSVR